MKVFNYSKTEQKNSIWINVFCYENVFCCENNLVYPVHIWNQKFENCMDLLLITNKILTNLCVIKQKTRKKNLLQIFFTIF